LRKCTFGELTEKEVINSSDCRRLGNVTDCAIDLETGRIISVEVCSQNSIFCFSKPDDCVNIPWECIRKIGDDMILVDIILPPVPPCPPKPQKCERKNKIFFSH